MAAMAWAMLPMELPMELPMGLLSGLPLQAQPLVAECWA
jgi:hypothetical protein